MRSTDELLLGLAELKANMVGCVKVASETSAMFVEVVPGLDVDDALAVIEQQKDMFTKSAKMLESMHRTLTRAKELGL